MSMKRVLDLTEDVVIDDDPQLSPNLISEQEEELEREERNKRVEMERAIITYDITNQYIVMMDKFVDLGKTPYDRHSRHFVIQKDRARAMRNRFQCYCHVNSAIEAVLL